LTLRTIDQNKVLFELNRTNLKNQIDQVKLNRANLFAPPAIGQRAGQSETTATFLAQAIQGLSSQQNTFLSLWAQYEVLRRNLDFDMGTMELDPNFEWVDPGAIDSSIGSRVAAREGVAENDRFCCGMQQSQMQMINQYEGEVIDSQYLDQNYPEGAEVDSAFDPPTDAVEPLEYEGTNTIEIDSMPEKSSRKVQEVSPPVPIPDPPVIKPPVLDPMVELPPLSNLVPAKSPDIRTAVARSPQLQPAAIPSVLQSTRSGFLDPFRRGTGSQSSQRRLIAEKPSFGDINPWDTSGDSSLKRAFEAKAEEVAKPVESTAKAQATILRR
jgi:hypothetical protein